MSYQFPENKKTVVMTAAANPRMARRRSRRRAETNARTRRRHHRSKADTHGDAMTAPHKMSIPVDVVDAAKAAWLAYPSRRNVGNAEDKMRAALEAGIEALLSVSGFRRREMNQSSHGVGTKNTTNSSIEDTTEGNVRWFRDKGGPSVGSPRRRAGLRWVTCDIDHNGTPGCHSRAWSNPQGQTTTTWMQPTERSAT